VHALARTEAEDEGEQAAGPPAEILDEASFRAARDGVEATLPDADNELRPVCELLEEMTARVRPAARELGCEAQLDDLAQLLDDGGGAGLQRAACGDDEDFDALLQALVARAGEAAQQSSGT
jgi:carboxylate-amine ligase